MSTIPLNTEEFLNEKVQDKKESQRTGKTKPAIAAGLGGLATGAGVKAVADSLTHEKEEDVTSETEYEVNDEMLASQTSDTSEPIDNNASEIVNPEDIMLEEPVLETTIDDIPEGEKIHNEVDLVYEPFTNEDTVEDVIYEGPLPEETLYAESLNLNVNDDNTIVDLICGETNNTENLTDEIQGELTHLPDEQYAWDTPSLEETDIQSDLMA